MTIQRKRVAKRLASGLLAGALALGGLAISGGSVSAKTPSSPSTNRIAGDDRYETAVAIARNQLATGTPTEGLVIASGESPYDALAASVLTTDNRPMVLVRKDSIPSAVIDFIEDYKSAWISGAPKIYLIGGEAAVSKSVEDALAAAVKTSTDLTPATVTRVFGATRYETARKIAEVTGILDGGDTLIIANGEDGKWADALTFGPYASDNEFPIVTTTGASLNEHAKAVIDAYLVKAGSFKKFLIAGGPASVSPAIVEYLTETKLVPFANIQRIGGADRYHTGLLFNVWLAQQATFNGSQVALASGETPFDALVAASWAAKNGVHIMLTPAAGGNPFVATLSGALADSAHDHAAATVAGLLGDNLQNSVLWILGGRNAVSDAAKVGYIAVSSAGNLTSTLTDCTPGNNYISLELSGKLTASEAASFEQAAVMAQYFKLNSAVLSDTTGTTMNIDGYFDPSRADLTSRQFYGVSLSASLKVGDVVTFAGLLENSVAGTAAFPERGIAGASCTVAADTSGPTFTSVRAVSGSAVAALGNVTTSVGPKIILKTSESVSIGSLVFDPSSSGSGDTGTISVASAGVTVSGTPSDKAITVTALNGSFTEFMLQFAHDDAALAAFYMPAAGTRTVTIGKAIFKDLAGNNAAEDASANIGVDSTLVSATMAPTFTAAAICHAKANADATLTAGALKVKASGAGIAKGKLGNTWTLAVVNQRGATAPSVVIDSTAKTIVVTADTGYHTAGDVKAALINSFDADLLLGNWIVMSSATELATKLSATLVPAKGTGGLDTCRLSISASEPVRMSTDGLTNTVGGLGAPFVGTLAHVSPSAPGAFAGTTNVNTMRSSWLLQFDTEVAGTGTITPADSATTGVIDSSGNRTTLAVTYTVN